MNLSFLCTGNACRSTIGEAVFEHPAPHGLRAGSAGRRPAGRLS